MINDLKVKDVLICFAYVVVSAAIALSVTAYTPLCSLFDSITDTAVHNAIVTVFVAFLTGSVYLMLAFATIYVCEVRQTFEDRRESREEAKKLG